MFERGALGLLSSEWFGCAALEFGYFECGALESSTCVKRGALDK